MSGSKIERITVNLPANFDARRHTQAVLAKIADKHGEGWEVESIDSANNRLTATRYAQVTETSTVADDTLVLGLARGTKPSDGEKIAAKFEDAHPGFRLTKFDPYLGQATMTRLPAKVVRAREAVRVALGVKPWDVQVRATRDGGFEVELPKSYSPSKHYAKLVEVAEQVIGRPGWYVKANAAELTARIIPGERPTFEPAYPFPIDAPIDMFRLPLGRTLPAPGEEATTLKVNLADNVGLLLQGLAGSGKAEVLTNRVPVPVSARRPDGWATIGDLTNDDVLYGPNGEVVQVAGFSDIQMDDTFDVTFDDGQVVRVGAEHAWEVSSYESRTRHYQGDRKHPGGVFAPVVKRLRALLQETEPGTYGTVADIAALAGVPTPRVYATVASNDMAELTVATNQPGGSHSIRKVRHYDAEKVAALLREEGLGQDLTAKASGRWATATELAFAAGLGTEERAVNKVRHRLRKHNVPYRMVTQRVEHKASLWSRAQKVYPVTEVLKGLISFYEDARGRAPLTEVRTTREMAQSVTARGGTHANWAVRMPEAIEAPEAELPVDPYLLGAWLGDGTSRTGAITVGRQDASEQFARLSALWDGPVSVTEDRDAITVRFGRDMSRCRRGHDGGNWAIAGGGSRYCRACRTVDGRSDPLTNVSLREELRALGVLRNKHIPAVYRRASVAQRLALLQGLMDTDGTISRSGRTELCLTNEQLAADALEVIRSLGIKASMSRGPAAVSQGGERRVVGVRFRITFTTSQRIFRLGRKAQLLPETVRDTGRWLYVKKIEPAGRRRVRCVRLATREAMYLTGDFVPTHNSVLINGFIYSALASGHEVAVIDVPHKKADFEWMKPFVREHGWGCDSLDQALTVVSLVYEEGQRRGQLFDEYGVKKWQDLPDDVRRENPILTLIVDELSGLLTKETIPKSLPKDHPMRVEAEERAAARDMLTVMLTKLPAEMRAAGIRLLYATQQAQANTGIPPAVKLNIPNRILLGANPSKQQRGHAFATPEKAPEVPEYIIEDAAASRGVGVAEFEGQPSVVFKSFFAPDDAFDRALRAMGVRTASRPEPTAAQIDRIVPRLDEDEPQGRPASRLDSEGGWGERDGRDAPDPKLRGAAAAAHQLRVEAAQAARGR